MCFNFQVIVNDLNLNLRLKRCDKKEKKMNESMLYTTWVCIVIATPCFVSGISSGFASISIPQLNLDLDDSSWFGSLNIIAALFGCLLSGSIIDRFGRKPSLLVSVLLGVIGWFCMCINGGTKFLFFGRFLTGLSNGATFFPTQIYAGECTDKHPVLFKIRGSFTLFATAATSFGFFVVSVMGTFIPYYQVAFITCVLSFCSFLLIALSIPESPVWLYYKGKLEMAKNAQKILHISRLRDSDPLMQGSSSQGKFTTSALKRRDVYIPVFIITFMHALLSLSGCGIFTCYLVELIDFNNSMNLEDSYKISIVAAFLAFSVTICEIFAIPFLGIRKTLIISSSLLGLCLAVYGAVNLFTVTEEYTTLIHVICIGAVWLGSFFANGMLAMTKALIGEIFPVDGKRFAAIPTVMFCIVDSFVMKLYPYLVVYIQAYTFIMYAVFSISFSIFVFYFIPETVGRTMDEIQEEFMYRTYF